MEQKKDIALFRTISQTFLMENHYSQTAVLSQEAQRVSPQPSAQSAQEPEQVSAGASAAFSELLQHAHEAAANIAAAIAIAINTFFIII